MEPGRVAAGSLGPRLAGRLTAELILRSPQYMNCVKEYEIDLRGLSAIVDAGRYCRSMSPFCHTSNIWQLSMTMLRAGVTHVETSMTAGSKINSIENLGATQVLPVTYESFVRLLHVAESSLIF